MNATLTRRSVELCFEIEGAPDLPVPGRRRIVPDHLTITYREGRSAFVMVSGLYRLKSGEISENGNSESWTLPGWRSEDCPDWVVALVAEHKPEWFERVSAMGGAL